MSDVFTNYKNCLYGGEPGGNGHRVRADQMTKMMSNYNVIHLCEDCKDKRLALRRKKDPDKPGQITTEET